MSKGIIYSLLTLFLIVPIIMLVITYSRVLKTEGENIALRVRADSLKYFYESVLQDLDRVIFISMKRSILYATDVVVSSGIPFSNSEEKLSEMIKNGTLEGQDVLMLKGTEEFPCNTVVCWMNGTIYLSREFGFEISINLISIDVTPYDSWNLNISTKIGIYLSDDYLNMSINRTVTRSVKVPIIGFEDPLYPLYTQGKVSRMINKSTETPISSGTDGFGWAIGEITHNIDAENKSKKVFVTLDDLSLLDIDKLNDFEAVISTQSTIPNNLNVPYLVVDSIDALTDGKKVFVENITLGVWDLNNDINKKYYHESYLGPSFLDRLEGRLEASAEFRAQTSNIIGLLSFVDFDELASYPGLTVDRDRSCVDYFYFGSVSKNLC